MNPRTILYTGKGGVGKTSVAAASARRCAASGRRTLVLSTDRAHSLAESLQSALGADPVEVSDRLWGQEIDPQREMERYWSGVQGWLGELLIDRGVDRISAEELTVPPGMDELFALLTLQRHSTGEEYEVVIVDCAPTGETLRLLSFPDIARWWLEKVVGAERALLAAARPIARSLLDIPLPSRAMFEDIHRLSQSLVAMNEILRDRERCSIRLVMNPDRMVIGEAMRTFTYLNLYGFLTDAIIVNRVFGPEIGEFLSGWRAVQQEQLELVRSAFSPVPVLCAPYFEQEVIGPQMLDRLAEELFGTGGHDVGGVLHHALTQEITVDEDGGLLRLALPFAERGDLTLKKIGLELVVGVGRQRRTIMLPPTLAAMAPTGARLRDGGLEVSFSAGPRPIPA